MKQTAYSMHELVVFSLSLAALVLIATAPNIALSAIPGSVPVALNSTVEGALSSTPPYKISDVYTITTQNKGFLLVSVTPDANLDLWAQLLDMDGIAILSESNVGGAGAGEAVSVRYLNEGTYYLMVGLISGEGTYNAGVYFTAADSVDAEPNDTPDNALTLPPNGQMVGNIGYRGGLFTDRIDVFSVTLPDDGSLELTVYPDGDLRVGMRLIDWDGYTELRYVDSRDAGGSETILYPNLAAGTYYCQIIHAAGAGSYSLTSRFNAAPTGGDSETNGAREIPLAPSADGGLQGSLTGRIGYFGGQTQDDMDIYQVNVPGYGNLKLEYEFTSGDSQQATLRILDTENRYLSETNDPSLNSTVLKAGVYTVIFIRRGGYGGYRLNAFFTEAEAPLSNVVNPINIAPNGQSSAMELSDDSPLYYLTTTLPQHGRLRVIAAYPNTIHATVTLLDEKGIASYGSSSSYYAEREVEIVANNLRPGAYAIQLYRHSGSGPISVRTEFTAATFFDDEPNDMYSPHLPLHTIGETIVGNIGYHGNGWNDVVDYFLVRSNDDGQLVLTVKPENTMHLSVGLSELHNGAPISIASGSSYYNPAGFTVSKPDRRAGDYIVWVWLHSGYGSYQIETEIAPNRSGDAEPNAHPHQAIHIEPNQGATGTLGYVGGYQTDVSDWYRVVLPADGSFYVHYQSNASIHDDVYLYRDDYFFHNRVQNAGSYYNWNQVQIGAPNLLAGTYYIQIYRHSGYGTYNFHTVYRPKTPIDTPLNDLPRLAREVGIGEIVHGSLGYVDHYHQDREDWYAVNIPSEGQYKVTWQADNTMHGEIRVFANSMARLSTDGTYYNAGQLITRTLNLTAGTYFLSAFRHSGYGTYTIWIGPPEGVSHGTISGRVASTQGMPLYEVNVSMRGRALKTDFSGRFTYEQVPPGKHTLRFESGAKYYILDLEVDVIAGQTTNADVTLREANVTPPANPDRFYGFGRDGHAHLFWSPSVSHDVADGGGYKIAIDRGEYIDVGNALVYIAEGLQSDRSYVFSLITYDKFGNESEARQIDVLITGGDIPIHPTPTPMPTPTFTPVPGTDPTATPSPTPTPGGIPTVTPLPEITPTPSPTPEPGAIFEYVGTLTPNSGHSVMMPRSYADVWRFTLSDRQVVVIDLMSDELDSYLFLYRGDTPSVNSLLDEDDDGGDDYDSRLSLTLDAGTYCIEATTYDHGDSGPYRLRSTVPLTRVDITIPTPTPIYPHEPEPIMAYEFDQPDLSANGWVELPGGFNGLPPGSNELVDLPGGMFPQSRDGKGLRIDAAPGEVAFLFANAPIHTQGLPILLRMTARADSANAGVFLVGLKGNLASFENVDGSVVVLNPATSAMMTNEPKRLTLLYEPDNGTLITPAVQVVSVDSSQGASVWIDRIEAFLLTPGVCFDGAMFSSSVANGHDPAPAPTITPTPTPINGQPVGETVTISLDLPEGATPLEMVLIPAGVFVMGSPEDEQNRHSSESPQRLVTISRDFYMGKYEITQAQFEAVMGDNPSWFSGHNLPVEQVSWMDAAIFCNRLSEMMGLQPVYDESDESANMNAHGFRLPTEAEWEYACRAGTTTAFYWGDDSNYSEIGEYAWYSRNSEDQPREVGLKPPNAFGLFDMSGNVWEWCQDWYGDYPNQDQVDPLGPQLGMTSRRLVRGGAFGDSSATLRSARRDWIPATQLSGGNIGFRIVIPIVERFRR